MKIVISGGLGYVGGRLSKYLAEHGHDIIALSRQAKTLPFIDWPVNMRVLHPEEVMQHKDQLRGADAFIHLAALNEHDCVKYPERAIEVNITGTLLWLDFALEAGIKKFIYFSTAHVYGKPLEGFYDENSLTRPVHPYAITHKCAEDYVLAYGAEKGMSNIVVRMTNSFGGPAFPTADRWTLLVNDLCRAAVKKGEMVLLSDGLQSRDFICLEDVCKGVQHLLDLPEKGVEHIYNLGGGRSITVWDMAQLVHSVAEGFLEKKIKLKRGMPSPTGSSPELDISIKRLKSGGFSVKGDYDKEIISTLAYFNQYNA